MFKWDINKEARRIAKEISDHFDDYVNKYKNIAKQVFEDWNAGEYNLKDKYQLHDREVELAKFFLILNKPRELDLLDMLDWFSAYNAEAKGVEEIKQTKEYKWGYYICKPLRKIHSYISKKWQHP